MTRYPRRLIDVDLPIKRISAHARREKFLTPRDRTVTFSFWQLAESGSASGWLADRLATDLMSAVPPGFVVQMQADHVLHHVRRTRGILQERGGA